MCITTRPARLKLRTVFALATGTMSFFVQAVSLNVPGRVTACQGGQLEPILVKTRARTWTNSHKLTGARAAKHISRISNDDPGRKDCYV
jgi:hypothetical protein